MAGTEDAADELDPKWIAEFLQRLQAGSERQRKLGELRPSGRVIGGLLADYCNWLGRSLESTQMAHAPEAQIEDHGYADMHWNPAGSSLATSDLVWGDSLAAVWGENPIRANLDLVRQRTAATMDHFTGAAVLIESTELARAPISAIRSGAEACSVAAFLMDPEVDQLERLRRGVNVRLASLEEQRRNLTGELEQEYRDDICKLLAAAEASGFKKVQWKPGFGPMPRVAGPNSKSDSAGYVLGELLEREHELAISSWRTMSGATHSKDDVALLIMDPWSGHPDIYMRNKGIAFVTVPAIFALTNLAPRLEAYLGWDLGASESLGRSLGLRTAWEMAAGLYDDELEQRLSDQSDDVS